MLLNREKSILILVDVQEKLTHLVMHSKEFISRCSWMLRLASALNVPIIVSEQYPKGLGSTLKELKELVKDAPCIDKVTFSCYREPNFVNQCHNLTGKQIILIGIETHVCILQTAIDMHRLGLEVFVVVDAVSSRHDIDHRYGLKRMKHAGVQLVTAEMVFFEWLEKAGNEEFKKLSQQFLRD